MTTDLEKEREAIKQIIIDHLTAVYVCNRVWGAWYVGTMSQDDFEPAQETDLPDGLADALMARAALAAPAAPPIGPSEQQEQAALEEWLTRVRPSGDVDSVRRQWEASGEYADLYAPQEQLSDEEIVKLAWHRRLHYEDELITFVRARLSRYGTARQAREDAAGQVERLDVENRRLRLAMQNIMARLADLLDEDQFGNIERIVTAVGVKPGAS